MIVAHSITFSPEKEKKKCEFVNSWNCEFVKLRTCAEVMTKRNQLFWRIEKIVWTLQRCIEIMNNKARHNLMDAKYRWHSDQLDGTENSRELLCQTKVMQIRQGETLNHQTIKEICHKMKNCFKNIGSVIYIFTDTNNRIKLFLQFTLWFQYENTEFPILPHSKIWLLDS